MTRIGAIAEATRTKARFPAIAGSIAAFAIVLLAAATHLLDQPALIAPFGSSSMLLFTTPESRYSKPMSVIGGHFLSTSVGLLVFNLIGAGPLACGIGVGLAIFSMQMIGLLHPPAAADPLVIIISGAGGAFLLLPVLSGTVTLVAIAWIYRRFVFRAGASVVTTTEDN